MAKRKLSPPSQEIVINQGDDFFMQLKIKDSKNQPVNITGYSFACKVRQDAESEDVLAEADCKIMDATQGLIEIRFTHEITSQIDTDGLTYQELEEYWYDVLQTDTEGYRTRILQGQFLVSPGISYH